MIKANELRIGNFVDWNGEVGIVSQLWEKDIFFKCGETDLYDAINPIPLTEEWFGKFGYYNENRPNHFIKDEMTIDEHTFWDCNGMFIEDKNGVRIRYVHQLQNLYFALKQRELTIKNQE
jgi:hypothetical protein